MTQILNPLPDKYCLNILCSYKNKTSTVQIIRITNIPHWYLERVIFPGESLLFEALPEAVLEIYSSDQNTTILRDRFVCDGLKVNQTADINT